MKHFLDLTDAQDRQVFVSADDISLITAGSSGNCTIILSGDPTGLTVKHTHQAIIRKLEDLKIVEVNRVLPK